MAGLPEGINDHWMNLPNLSCGGFLAISCRLGSLPARRCSLRLHRLLGSGLSQTPYIASTLPAELPIAICLSGCNELFAVLLASLLPLRLPASDCDILMRIPGCAQRRKF